MKRTYLIGAALLLVIFLASCVPAGVTLPIGTTLTAEDGTTTQFTEADAKDYAIQPSSEAGKFKVILYSRAPNGDLTQAPVYLVNQDAVTAAQEGENPKPSAQIIPGDFLEKVKNPDEAIPTGAILIIFGIITPIALALWRAYIKRTNLKIVEVTVAVQSEDGVKADVDLLVQLREDPDPEAVTRREAADADDTLQVNLGLVTAEVMEMAGDLKIRELKPKLPRRILGIKLPTWNTQDTGYTLYQVTVNPKGNGGGVRIAEDDEVFTESGAAGRADREYLEGLTGSPDPTLEGAEIAKRVGWGRGGLARVNVTIPNTKGGEE